jgi:hypothetical protein
MNGEEHEATIGYAYNYANNLLYLERFQEAKLVLRKLLPVVPRVAGECNELTLSVRAHYAMAIYDDDDAAIGDLREALTTLEETSRTARRVFGGAHPLAKTIGTHLRNARARFSARDTSRS